MMAAVNAEKAAAFMVCLKFNLVFINMYLFVCTFIVCTYIFLNYNKFNLSKYPSKKKALYLCAKRKIKNQV
jgi:hypothetical protein